MRKLLGKATVQLVPTLGAVALLAIAFPQAASAACLPTITEVEEMYEYELPPAKEAAVNGRECLSDSCGPQVGLIIKGEGLGCPTGVNLA